ncbi:hypothetical protein [Paenibacillus sp. FSL K6-1230]|uniref:hypothetical protein n=2 Tax=Paenibacillus TaxID=44249 RepID=UPI0003A79964
MNCLMRKHAPVPPEPLSGMLLVLSELAEQVYARRESIGRQEYILFGYRLATILEVLDGLHSACVRVGLGTTGESTPASQVVEHLVYPERDALSYGSMAWMHPDDALQRLEWLMKQWPFPSLTYRVKLLTTLHKLSPYYKHMRRRSLPETVTTHLREGTPAPPLLLLPTDAPGCPAARPRRSRGSKGSGEMPGSELRSRRSARSAQRYRAAHTEVVLKVGDRHYYEKSARNRVSRP